MAPVKDRDKEALAMCAASNGVEMATGAAGSSVLESCTVWDDRILILGAFGSKEPQRRKRHERRKMREKTDCCLGWKNRSTSELESWHYPGSLNRYKTTLKKHRKLEFNSPSVPRSQTWTIVPSGVPAVRNTFWHVPGC